VQTDGLKGVTVVKTYGLTHIALSVRDVAKSSAFYQSVFGMKVIYEDTNFVQLQTPASRDVLVLERGAKAGHAGAVSHFGFRLQRKRDIEKALESVKAAGGRVRETGEFVPGEPYLFAFDPDGNEFEIWYEIPTKVDPKPLRPAARR
jgi:catechol 2,3-dioxygenase-like lactoylglutathione lyase family enzyme